MRYHDVQPISREDAEGAFCTGDPKKICDALIRLVFHESEWRVAQEECMRFSTHADAAVRGLAATCFGHLARIHGTLDLKRVLPALKRLLADPVVSGRAQDALDDIEMYLGVKGENLH